MTKIISWKQKLGAALFWSIIAAAFIGPGTVTTASMAGATYGTSLLWAITFSVIATIVMQEASARVTLASGKSLGEIIAIKYPGSMYPWLLFGSIFIGCAAYEAGNILGALSGIQLIYPGKTWLLTTLITMSVVAFLWFGQIKSLANLLGAFVAFMGVIFTIAGLSGEFIWSSFFNDLFIPKAPEGSLLLVIGLIGTTIVPYNLFLASGIGQGQSLTEMRTGVVIAVIIGGIISIGILLVGTLVKTTYSFQALVDSLTPALGQAAKWVVGLGLFAAGFTSAMTAPLAAAITGQSLFGKQLKWSRTSLRYRLTWSMVLLTGFVLGVTGIKPIPVIILAQALNGILLPVVGIFVFKVINDHDLLPGHTNSSGVNILLLFILGIITFIGLFNLGLAITKLFPSFAPLLPAMAAGLTFVMLGLLILLHLLAIRRND